MKENKNKGKISTVFRSKYMITSITLLSIILMFQYKYHEVLSVYNNDITVHQSSKLYLARLLFGRTRSRITGRLLDIEIPHGYRLFIYNLLIKYMSINKNEIKYPIESYKSISELFSRYIREETRPIEDVSEYSIISPCDSEIVDFGELNQNLNNVKGINFNVETFLGVNLQKKHNDDTTKFYYAIFYLSPKKYHHFHAPFDFTYNMRRHISGEVFPLFKGMFKFINNIFNINERVILGGEWKGGKVYYAAISAYNVGNIKIVNDDELLTNNLRTQLSYIGGDIDTKFYETHKKVEIGDEVGEFKLGSSIILIFENKKDFVWDVKENQTVSVGQRIGGVNIPVSPKNKLIKIKS